MRRIGIYIERQRAWVRRRDSHAAAVRFGSLVHDLECYVDNSLLRDEAGEIVGRRGGVKAWLRHVLSQ